MNIADTPDIKLTDVVNQVLIDFPEGCLRPELINEVEKRVAANLFDIKQAIDDLVGSWQAIYIGDTYVATSKASMGTILEATEADNYPNALSMLLQKGVFHPDMERFGMTEGGSLVKEDQTEASTSILQTPEGSIRVDKAQGESATYEAVDGTLERVSGHDLKKRQMDQPEASPVLSVDVIHAGLLEISPSALATELGGWLCDNVESFIDNQETVFRLYLSIGASMGMPASGLYQKLYIAVPDVGEGVTEDQVASIYDALDSKLADAKEIMNSDVELKEKLFKKMIFFYELTGFVVKDGKVTQPVTKPLNGSVVVNELAFDPVSMTTTVAQGIGSYKDGTIVEGNQKAIIRQEEIPAGFGIELEILIQSPKLSSRAMY